MLNEINCGDVLVTCEVLYSVKMLEIPGMIFTKEIFLPKKKCNPGKFNCTPCLLPQMISVEMSNSCHKD